MTTNIYINDNKLTTKILSEDETNICNIIKEFEDNIYSIITTILLLLKNNEYIYHINNYISYNYTDNIIDENIPIMLLLGGMSYKIYSLFYNKYFNKDIIPLDRYLINSIDYDFSIIVKKQFLRKL